MKVTPGCPHRDARYSALSGFAEIHRRQKREHSISECEVNREAHRHILRDYPRHTQRVEDPLNKSGIVRRCACHHREKKCDRLPTHQAFQNARPLGGAPFDGKRIVSEGLVRPARACFCCAAEHAIDEKEREEQRGISARGKGEYRHLNHHQDRSKDNHSFSAELVRQRTRGYFKADDGRCPCNIEQRKFLDAQAEVEKEHRHYRIVPARVEQDPEGYEERNIAAERASVHRTPKRLSSFLVAAPLKFISKLLIYT